MLLALSDAASTLAGISGSGARKRARSGSDEGAEVAGARAGGGGRWTDEEHAAFLDGVAVHGHSWTGVQRVVKTRSREQVRAVYATRACPLCERAPQRARARSRVQSLFVGLLGCVCAGA
jgi:hypothetical protein